MKDIYSTWTHRNFMMKKKKYYLISLREIRFYKLNFHRREIFRLTHCLL